MRAGVGNTVSYAHEHTVKRNALSNDPAKHMVGRGVTAAGMRISGADPIDAEGCRYGIAVRPVSTNVRQATASSSMAARYGSRRVGGRRIRRDVVVVCSAKRAHVCHGGSRQNRRREQQSLALPRKVVVARRFCIWHTRIYALLSQQHRTAA